MNSFNIVEIQSCLGEIETSPSELFSDDDGRIAKKTGISKIHRATSSAYQLAEKAASKLTHLDDDRANLRYVFYVTQ